MATKRVFEALFNWFGTKQFQVNGMSSTRVDEFAKLAGCWSPNFHGTKSQFGKWLSATARGDTECVLENGQKVRLVLKREGTGHPAAIYQLQLASSG